LLVLFYSIIYYLNPFMYYYRMCSPAILKVVS